MRDTQTERCRANILGIPVDRRSRIEFRMFLDRAFVSKRAHRIVTLNPEIALAASRNPRYGVAVRTADLVTIDGIGIALALRCLGCGGGSRITGNDVFEDLATFAQENGKTIAFLLRDDGLTSPPVLRDAIRKRWPSLRSMIGTVNVLQPINAALMNAIVDAAPDIIIINFGHPEQEQWLAEHLDRFPSVRVAAGIGGALDYFSGAVPAPPLLVRKFGVEWLWRLLRQPRRIRRIFRAVIVFPVAVFSDSVRRWWRGSLFMRLHSS